MDLIVSEIFRTKLNQSELIVVAVDIDKDATTLVSDIIAPYDNIILFDANRNNADVIYQQNSAPLYPLLRPQDLSDYIIGKLDGLKSCFDSQNCSGRTGGGR